MVESSVATPSDPGQTTDVITAALNLEHKCAGVADAVMLFGANFDWQGGRLADMNCSPDCVVVTADTARVVVSWTTALMASVRETTPGFACPQCPFAKRNLTPSQGSFRFQRDMM